MSCPVRALTPSATTPICALEQRVEILKQAVEGHGARAAATEAQLQHLIVVSGGFGGFRPA